MKYAISCMSCMSHPYVLQCSITERKRHDHYAKLTFHDMLDVTISGGCNNSYNKDQQITSSTGRCYVICTL
jgi:hypothetical protein